MITTLVIIGFFVSFSAGLALGLRARNEHADFWRRAHAQMAEEVVTVEASEVPPEVMAWYRTMQQRSSDTTT